MTTRAYEWRAAKLASVKFAGEVFGKPVWKGSVREMMGFYKLVDWFDEKYGKEK